ncbi:argininosuccinate lyase [Kribbella orskensis]|uniref:argininosuccinate lyase n=1 Tax=Kribbella orskensis TaxID=2512216 RepID=A0ABY2BGH8_9ACTN|nr:MULTISPECIES: lyase family protein [Kribbella]TCN37934.1 argininosuccinate lyase [Kribbella sp. VKM Ac-2500]TCO19420.1 argininosuccinate lyase [Kribbella orskensis]
MSRPVPDGYLGAEARISSGPAPELVEAGYALETADAPLLHHGLGLADLAHVLALHEAGVIPAADAGVLLAALLELRDVPAEAFPYDPVYGDAYNSRERELERRLGSVAGWLHTGRTRREAGRIAFRLALRNRLLDLHEAVGGFLDSVCAQSAAHADSVWADTTYLQPAQSSTFGHYLGGFGEEAARHLDRLQLAYRWADRSPAGVGGVGGSRVPMNRSRLAEVLGFECPGAHTRDIMWAADGLADAVVAAAQAATTVDRLAEDLEIFASPGFGYVTLDASLCRASVLMPQKRNPYALAVIRAGAGTLVGRATGLLVTQLTPSARTDNWLHAYGEVAGALELARRVVALGAEVVRTLSVDRDALAAAAAAHFTGATDLAEELVLRHALDYRSAYRVVGRAVATATNSNRTTLTIDDLTCAATDVLGHPLNLDPRILHDALDPAQIVAGRTVLGGSAPDRVREHSRSLTHRHAEAAAWRQIRRIHARETEAHLIATALAVATPAGRR